MNYPAYIGSKRMMRLSCRWFGLLALLCLTLGGRAQEADAKKTEAPKGTTIKTAAGGKLLINAKSVLYDFTKRLATFETNVTVTDSQIHLTADRMDVFLTAENSVQRVEAVGNVVIRELGSAKKATAGNGVYDTVADNVVLTDKPYLEDRDQGFYTKGAERIIYFRGKQQFKAEGENMQIEFGIREDQARDPEEVFRLPGKAKDGAVEKKDGAVEKKETPAP
jgi:lipopolysaccharide transport protein LptA